MLDHLAVSSFISESDMTRFTPFPKILKGSTSQSRILPSGLPFGEQCDRFTTTPAFHEQSTIDLVRGAQNKTKRTRINQCECTRWKSPPKNEALVNAAAVYVY